MSLVYIATCLVNGEIYIGITSRSLKVRIGEHFSNAKKPDKGLLVFHRAIKKYGQDNFKFEVYSDHISHKEAEDLEVQLIKELKPKYNVHPGGKSSQPGVVRTEEYKRNMSLAKKGLKPSAAFLAAAAKRRGLRLSGDTLTNVRAANGYSILCVNDNKRYQSIVAAAEAYGLSRHIISQCCKNGKPTKSGLSFKNESSPKSAIAKRQRRVMCLDDGLVYESALAASARYGVYYAQICAVCRGHKASANGLHFAYYDENFCEDKRQHLLNLALERTSTHGWCNRNTKRKTLKHPVLCLNDNKPYDSVRSASQAYALDSSNISKHCRKGTATKNGLRFMYADKASHIPMLLKAN